MDGLSLELPRICGSSWGPKAPLPRLVGTAGGHGLMMTADEMGSDVGGQGRPRNASGHVSEVVHTTNSWTLVVILVR